MENSKQALFNNCSEDLNQEIGETLYSHPFKDLDYPTEKQNMGMTLIGFTVSQPRPQ